MPPVWANVLVSRTLPVAAAWLTRVSPSTTWLVPSIYVRCTVEWKTIVAVVGLWSPEQSGWSVPKAFSSGRHFRDSGVL